jgi:hypothetical protein
MPAGSVTQDCSILQGSAHHSRDDHVFLRRTEWHQHWGWRTRPIGEPLWTLQKGSPPGIFHCSCQHARTRACVRFLLLMVLLRCVVCRMVKRRQDKGRTPVKAWRRLPCSRPIQGAPLLPPLGMFVDRSGSVLQHSLSTFFNGKHSDLVVVAPDGRRLACHRVILSAGSPKIASLLDQQGRWRSFMLLLPAPAIAICSVREHAFDQPFAGLCLWMAG